MMQGVGPGQRGRRRSGLRPSQAIWLGVGTLCVVVLLVYIWHLQSRVMDLVGPGGDSSSALRPGRSRGRALSETAADALGGGLPAFHTASVLVSYAYYEKDPVQRSNLEYFLEHGWVAPPAAAAARRAAQRSASGGSSGGSSGGGSSSDSGTGRVAWVFVVAGDACGPCHTAFPITTPLEADLDLGVAKASRVDLAADDSEEEAEAARKAMAAQPTSSGSLMTPGSHHGNVLDYPGPGPGPTLLLRRSENVGMDLASHNITLEYLARHAHGFRYKYFIILNSSIKGPYTPSYMPYWWHWSYAFLERFQPPPPDDPRFSKPAVPRVLPPGTPYGNAGQRPEGEAMVRAVGSSLVCLPAADAGGPGPRLESWAMAMDDVALEVTVRAGVFHIRTCKTCADGADGIVVGGEYGFTAALLSANHNVATLMSKYDRRVDWRDRRHWGCNDNVHPSRHGTYDGIAFHPYETVFVKSSWHVADPYTRRYSLWATQHKEGDAGTEGEWNEKMYRYAISPDAIRPNLLEAAYNVTRVHELMAKQRDTAEAELEEEQRAASQRALAHDM